MIVRPVVLLLLSLALVGCNALLPSTPANIEDYVPSENEEAIEPNLEAGDFAAENFPNDCDWYDFRRVVDGDTIVVDQNLRVRLIGIDTPEIKHPEKGVEPFGLAASDKTKEFLNHIEKVCLIEDKIGDKYDRYARKLAYVFTAEGLDVNAELIKIGLAEAYRSFPFERKAEFIELEKTARTQQIGQWE